jgi:hypothetical protein
MKGAGIMQSPLICNRLQLSILATHISSIAIPLSLSMSFAAYGSSVPDIIKIEYIKLYPIQVPAWSLKMEVNPFK